MRVRLKGINQITKRLADGRVETYYYAWKGGPRLRGEPGSPDFIASYNEAVARKVAPPPGVMLTLLRYYEGTSEFLDLTERTKDDYRKKVALIETKFGDFPLAALSDPRTRGVFKEWRDELAKSSRRQADYAWAVFARVLSVAKDRGKITVNPCEKGGRLYAGSRRDIVWSLEDEATYLANCPVHMRLPLLLAVWTGQRQGDLLGLKWWSYDGTHIRLTQSKSVSKLRRGGPVRVVIKVGARLKAALDEAKVGKGPADFILVNSDGQRWTGDGFRSSWRKACIKAGIVGVTFHDLRGTAVTRLALAGNSEAEIAYITGHTMSDVRSILDAHYLGRDPRLGESAILKLETWSKQEQNLPTDHPTSLSGSENRMRKAE
jgi:integrase